MREKCRGRIARCTLSLLLALGWRGVSSSEAPRFWLETRGGSWLLCEIDAPTQPLFRTGKGTRSLALTDIVRLTFAPHDDPNLLNEAIVACGDLASDDFERREHAVERLKKLGPVARNALETARKSTDREAARQAKALLSALVDTAPNFDSLTTRSGETVRGSVVAEELTVATRWRRFIFPLNALKTLELCNKPPPTWTPHREGAPEICNDDAGPPAPADFFQPLPEGAFNPSEVSAHSTLILPSKIPTRTKDGTVIWKAPDGDEALDDAYAAVDVWMRPLNSDSHVQSSMNGPMSLFHTSATKLELSFSAPPAADESPHARALRGPSRGVHSLQIALPSVDGAVFLRAYDRNDRVVGTVRATSVWVGFNSEVPIARVRLKYSSSAAAPISFRFGPISLGQRLSAMARPNEACVTLSSGEIVTGEFRIVDATHFSVHPEFAGTSGAPLILALDELVRLEAPWKPAEQFVGPPPRHQMQAFFWPQDIVLQTGDRLKAELVLLNDKEAILELGQNVRLLLPRLLLRRVGFRRFRNDEENLNQSPAVAAAEKPGVKLFTKADLTNTASPQVNEEADPKHNPAAGLQTVDNAEVVAFNAEQREITLRDNDGEFPFDAGSVKAIVFPIVQAPGARKGTWRLTLRNGLSLAAELLEMNAGNLVLEIAGGKVEMPLERIDSIERSEIAK